MRILITGARGMLGVDAALASQARAHDVIRASRGLHDGFVTVDTDDPDRAHAAIAAIKPDVVLHCAAHANVDGCERDPDGAYQGNAVAAKNVAMAADAVGAAMVYISTDYVFDGALGRPYVETDTPNPLNAYGCSKLAGERFVEEHCRRSLIVRTSWLYGANGKNFVLTMLNQARTRGELYVVADQHGTPTYTVDLAEVLVTLIEREATGIYHVTNQGETTWCDFARAIVEEAGLDVSIHPMTSEETAARFNTSTVRPKYSVLQGAAMESLGMPALRPWRDALRAFMNATAGR